MINDLTGTLLLMGYYLVFLLLLPTGLKFGTAVPMEAVRKLQHILYSFSVFLLLELFSEWYMAVAASFILAILAFPVLLLVENTRWYRKTFVDRSKKGGELRKQLIYVQLSFSALIFIFWGILGPEWNYVVAAAVMAWGFGDAAAALVGKALGQNRVLHYLVDKGKTFEGTVAMILFSGLASFLTLFLYGGQSWQLSLLVSLVAAPVCGVIELFSREGTDTITVPFCTAVTMVILLILFPVWGVKV